MSEKMRPAQDEPEADRSVLETVRPVVERCSAVADQLARLLLTGAGPACLVVRHL